MKDTTMENDYSVYDHITPDGMHYYGQSQNVEKRWSGNGCLYKGTALYPYIEKYGWENIKHIILFENQSKEDALSIEDSLIVSGWEKGNCINQRRSGNIRKEEGYDREYYEKNKDKKQEYDKQYYEQNKNKKKEQSKQYREQHKEQIKEQSKQYYENNKNKIKEQSKKYYENNRDKIRQYQRKYQQRKKQESKLKELGYISLF